MKKSNFQKLYKFVIASVLSFLSACSAATAPESKPAVLLASSAENTQLISQAMSVAMSGKRVTLVANVFLNSNLHVLEKRVLKGLNSNSADGLILGVPKVDRFLLYKQGSGCYLVYEKTGKIYPLQDLKCKEM